MPPKSLIHDVDGVLAIDQSRRLGLFEPGVSLVRASAGCASSPTGTARSRGCAVEALDSRLRARGYPAAGCAYGNPGASTVGLRANAFAARTGCKRCHGVKKCDGACAGRGIHFGPICPDATAGRPAELRRVRHGFGHRALGSRRRGKVVVMNVLEWFLIIVATLSALWWAFARHRAPIALCR
jgi:hypothetical protein